MPLYQYRCTKCKFEYEVRQKFSDQIQSKCPKCTGELIRPLFGSALQFKGSGFYQTDYTKNSSEGK